MSSTVTIENTTNAADKEASAAAVMDSVHSRTVVELQEIEIVDESTNRLQDNNTEFMQDQTLNEKVLHVDIEAEFSNRRNPTLQKIKKNIKRNS